MINNKKKNVKGNRKIFVCQNDGVIDMKGEII